MKSVHLIYFYFKNYMILLGFLQVNGSLLSRMKNRYEYLPLPLSEGNVEDMDDIVDEVSRTHSISATVMSIPIVSDEDNFNFIKYTEALNQKAVIINSTKLVSEFTTTTTQESKLEKRTINTEAVFYYYDQDKWPDIKLFVALTSKRFQQTPSTTKSTKHRRTWPPYFPPKFVSKLQSELDDALLPWKPTVAIRTNVSRNASAILLEGGVRKGNKHQAEAYCYQCGLDVTGIPRMPGCYHIFDNVDYITRKQLQRNYKVKCFSDSEKKQKNKIYYGPDYIGGCFKRFLDVGIEYNERGCRTKEPTVGKSYASKRLARLERMLKHTDNGCVFSPYASLTPFSRAISLYARYHVCVCNTKYCNQALRILPLHFYTFLLLTLYCII